MTDDYVDEPVQLEPGGVRMSADCMRALKKATGRTMTELMQDGEDEADRLQAMAFVELHRRAARLGHLPDAAVLWDQAGMVDIEFVMPEAVDPLKDGS